MSEELKHIEKAYQQTVKGPLTYEQFKQIYYVAFEEALSKKTPELQEKIRQGLETLQTTIRIEMSQKPFRHITLFFTKGTSLELLFAFWQKISQLQWLGQFVIEEGTPSRAFGPSKAKPGKFAGIISQVHKEVWLEAVESGIVFPEMPESHRTSEMEGYYFCPHISGYEEEGVIELAGKEVQLKFLGPVEPFAHF